MIYERTIFFVKLKNPINICCTVHIVRFFNKLLIDSFSDVRGIANRKHVQEGYEQVQQALLEYTVTCYPQIQVCLIFLSGNKNTKNDILIVKILKFEIYQKVGEKN